MCPAYPRFSHFPEYCAARRNRKKNLRLPAPADLWPPFPPALPPLLLPDELLLKLPLLEEELLLGLLTLELFLFEELLLGLTYSELERT